MTIVLTVFAILTKLFMVFVLLRFIAQYFKADFYNPVTQSVVKLTNPVLAPLRRLIPGFGGIDLASIILGYFLSLAILGFAYNFWQGYEVQLLTILLGGLLELLYALLDLFFYLLIGRVIASFLMIGTQLMNNPFVQLVIQLTDPILRPFQRIIPPVGMIDFSAIVVFIIITLSQQGLLSLAGSMTGMRLI
ncbi:YggT family protein [Pleionea sp. CnH1-48]|uniref:YggT family protein n=1 Tax=Pleionea sp. CnH1-48 TaxID=2954494 RepID=UPI0020969647|nr:YggT family protein [Pleionea sp. CnH1-48]MCO7225271.1 YggT family protein [Pleionea sp. CnH1-48]